jgi:ArsR family transcriptional regulator, arsenate/arsenite/antimonite-responsive transcriptional repressor
MNDVFRALADPTRRDILELLRNGPRTSGEIAERFPTSWATISRHLAVLRDADLILGSRDGQHVRYELNTTVFQDVVEHLVKWLRPGRDHA